MTTEKALDLALEALENSYDYVAEEADRVERMYGNYPTRQGKVKGLRQDERKHMEAITAIKQARSAPVQDSTCNNALREQGKAYPRTCRKCGLGPCIALANIALDKKAENARELGLDYEPATTVTSESGNPDVTMSWWHEPPLPVGTKLYTTPPAQPAPVQEPDHSDELTIAYMSGVHRGKELAAQRQWVGLTDEEMHACWDSPLTPLGMKHARMIEAKLREKNT